MSVQKFVFNRQNLNFNFTSVLNKVISGLARKNELLGFYLYIFHLPPGWIFYKDHLKRTCGHGSKKLERLLDELVQMRLIERVQRRNELGRFCHSEITVLNGDLFEIKDLEKHDEPPLRQNLPNEPKNEPVHRESLSDARLWATINKKQINEKRKSFKRSCSSKNDELFSSFWNLYPRKQKKVEAKKIWARENLDEIGSKILESIKKRLETEWKDQERQFIPLPNTFLNGERWDDELIVETRVKKMEIKESNEPRSTVQWYGPGHPSWESLHGKRH